MAPPPTRRQTRLASTFYACSSLPAEQRRSFDGDTKEVCCRLREIDIVLTECAANLTVCFQNTEWFFRRCSGSH